MYTAKYICILSAMLIAGVQAITTPIEGYGVVDFTWEVETSPGGPKENLTGTVQEVISQLSTINSNWKSDFNLTESLLPRSGLQKRLNFPFTSLLCNIRLDEWGTAYRNAINDGINYLNGVPGIPTNGPGPGNCGRVSCSYGSAIWWCNDETQTFSLPGFSTIAAGAQAIQDNCPDSPGSLSGLVNGQVFAQFLQNWNTIVRGDTC
ncbi:uncharacterized protein PAC_02366 [Phialocephala subalpina]|uniref:Secreted protein n=1 Tax=Phialocephala subalpina TaxID=576137 RepID=A0A1L7WI88_9HELO|nr:uncharacterized protein PAC_02366 [Phialocephala subalpina]